MSTISSSNPEYVNARVRSRRAALFDEDDYRNLMRMGPSEIARFMEESEYEEEVNALGSRYSGVDLIEHTLNRNLAKHFDDLLRWSEGRLYDLIARYLRKFDVWNVKTVLRGLYSGTGTEAIRDDLINAGEFDETFLNRIAEANSIDEVVELLEGTIFGSSLADAYDEYERSDVLVPLENAVDRAFYENLLADVGRAGDEATGQYIEYLRAEIDFRNVRNALRLARSGADIDPAEYYIEGGVLFRPQELRQLTGDRDRLVERIRESPYGDDLDQALDELEGATSLIGFEHALDAALLEFSDRLSYVYPMSIASVLSYILAKEREVENVRAIAHGREVGLDETEIRDELVIL